MPLCQPFLSPNVERRQHICGNLPNGSAGLINLYPLTANLPNTPTNRLASTARLEANNIANQQLANVLLDNPLATLVDSEANFIKLTVRHPLDVCDNAFYCVDHLLLLNFNLHFILAHI